MLHCRRLKSKSDEEVQTFQELCIFRQEDRNWNPLVSIITTKLALFSVLLAALSKVIQEFHPVAFGVMLEYNYALSGDMS